LQFRKQSKDIRFSNFDI